jgi:RNA polymerase sigma-70 factor (ECF subfamily)
VRSPTHEPKPSTDRVRLVNAIATLPPAQRRAIVLRYLGDLSVSDIAQQEDVSENTVKSWLRRAGPHLQHCWPTTK